MQYLNTQFRLLWLCSLFAVSVLAAMPTLANTTLTELRNSYRNSDSLLQQRKISKWLELKPSLKNYPLYPYLELREIRATYKQYSNARISELISNTDIPIPSYFNSWWLEKLAKQQDWQHIVKHFGNSSNTKTQCTHALALSKSASIEETKTAIEKLWLSARSQPKQCDPVFEFGLKKGLIDDALIWKRLTLSAKANNSRMVKYLGQFLKSPDVKKWVDRINRVNRDPETYISRNYSQWSNSSYGRDVIQQGIYRMVRKDLVRTAQFWRSLTKQHPLAASRMTDIDKFIAVRLGWRRHPNAYDWLASLNDEHLDSKTIQLTARNALASENWEGLRTTIEKMPDNLAANSVWTYWHARALQEFGDPTSAKNKLKSIAGQPSFYGLLAADKLNLAYDLQHTGPDFTIREIGSLVNEVPAIARIREWLVLQKPYNARRELNQLKKSERGNELMWVKAAYLFDLWSWNDGAIRAAHLSGHSANLDYSVTYPLPYIEHVRRESSRYVVPEHWIYGIMRQESNFIRDIRSSAGAVGLMQLLPSTARIVAKKNGLKQPTRADLSKASSNIRLGVSYFKSLLDRMDGNPVHALAGYNAGPLRSEKWRHQFQGLDPATWVETIPFTETRNYVKKILVNFIIYDSIYNASYSRIQDYLQPPKPQHAKSAN